MGRKLYLGSQAVTPVVAVVPTRIAPKGNVGGVYQADNTATSFNLDGATDVDNYALYKAFYNCTNLTSVDLSSLTTISGTAAMNYCFFGCTGLTSVDLSSLTTMNGSMAYCFQGCTNLTSVDLSSLTTISTATALSRAFYNCTGLTSVNLSSLTTMSSTSEMQFCFGFCTGLTTVTIGGTTAINFGTAKNHFNNMFGGCDQASGIDLYIATDEATLSQFTGYDTSGDNHHFAAACEVRIHYTAE